MRLSIRLRITLLITLVFACVLGLLLASSILAVYLGINEEVDRSLETRQKRIVDLFETEFRQIQAGIETQFPLLEDRFREELQEIHGHKPQFAVFAIRSRSGMKTIVAGGIGKPDGFPIDSILQLEAGYYNQHIFERRIRCLVSEHEWGKLIIGMQNRLFFEVVDELSEVLFVGVPLTLLLVLAGGRILAGLVLQPVAEAAKTAKDISLNNLAQRLPEYRGKDEFGVLVETLNEMTSRVGQGVRRIRHFTQDAAHELRTPLTIQRGELELLYQDPSLPPASKENIRKILDRAISMSRIIDNLLLLAQSDSGQYPISKKLFSLDNLVKAVSEDVQILLEGQPINILVEVDTVDFYGDEALLKRLVLNLADNAVKYTTRGQITFRLDSKSGHVNLRITDTGIGIPENQVSQIFDRFYRVDTARNSETGGSGLGLAICRWIVEAHNGSIEVQSQPGSGTTVTILFPISMQ